MDSDGLPGSHRSASAKSSACVEGAEEAADQRVWAVVAYERAQHVRRGASGWPDLHPRCMAVFADSVICKSLHVLLAAS